MARLVQPCLAAMRLVSPWQRKTMARPAMTWLTRMPTTSSGEDERDHGRGERGDDEREERVAAEDDDRADAGHRAHQHEALGAEREDAGLLADDQAERGERDRARRSRAC